MTRAMRTITVTIGRNVGDEPMDLDTWNQYASSVRGLVEGYANLWTVTPYKGSWNGTDEQAMIYYGPVSELVDLDRLRVGLSNLATYYQQDGIGLSVGESELVESFDAVPTV